MMDIKWAFDSAVRRGKDFMERTDRTNLESKKDTKYGFDNQSSALIVVKQVTSRENVQSQLSIGTKIHLGIKATSRIIIKTGITRVH
ncbi:hypothetical protein Hanom_Chr07g00586901 [Helianthus anomalus]